MRKLIWPVTDAATRPGALSEIILWPHHAAAQEALRAFRGPDAGHCVRSPVESATEGLGSGVSVKVNEVGAPPNVGAAAAFRRTIETTRGTAASSNTTLVFFIRGKAGVLITAAVLGGRPFPPSVLSTVIANAERQLKAAVAESR